jgi:hypothetical protein
MAIADGINQSGLALIADLSNQLDVVASRLTGLEPILRLLTDCTDSSSAVGDSLEAIGGLSKYLASEIGEIAQRMKEVAA